MTNSLWADLPVATGEYQQSSDDKAELAGYVDLLNSKEGETHDDLVNKLKSLSVAENEGDDENGLEELRNSVVQQPAELFLVRGPKYLEQAGKNVINLKQPSASPGYEIVSMQMFKSPVSLSPAAEKIPSLKAYLQSYKNNVAGDAPQFIVFCFFFTNLWKTEHTYVVHVFKRVMKIDSGEKGEDATLDRTFSRFLKCSTEEKTEKFKFAAKLREMGATVKAASDMLGGECPVIIAKRLTTTFTQKDNFFEVDVDIGSSAAVKVFKGVIFKFVDSMVIDYSFFIEGQSEDELPERLLGCVRLIHCNPDESTIKLDKDGNVIQIGV